MELCDQRLKLFHINYYTTVWAELHKPSSLHKLYLAFSGFKACLCDLTFSVANGVVWL